MAPKQKSKKSKKPVVHTRKKSKKKMKKISSKRVSCSFLQGPLHKTKIRVIGIGGGGGSIVSELASRLQKVSFVIANTDVRALQKTTRKAKRFSFGQSVTGGLGTGMNPELGRMAAENEEERIKKLLEGQDLCILVSSLGGGTGSGAVPVFAKISKKLGNLTYGIFTLPFKFEGEKKMEIAKDSFLKTRPSLDALTIIPNERIFKIIDTNTPLKEALSQINKILAQALEGLIETIYLPGLINIDFADFKTILQGQGRLTYLNTIEVKGPNRIEEAVRKITSSPLYPYNIQGAKGILFNIAGESDINLAEVSSISKSISESVNRTAKIVFGLSQAKNGGDEIRITLLATGCKAKIFSQQPGDFPKKISKISKNKFIREQKPKEVSREKKKSLPKKRKQKRTKEATPSPLKKTTVKLKGKPKKSISKTQKREKKEDKEKKSQKSGDKITPSNGLEAKEQVSLLDKPKENIGQAQNSFEESSNIKINRVRKNALQIREEAEKREQEMLKQEKKWETPAFLRKKVEKGIIDA